MTSNHFLKKLLHKRIRLGKKLQNNNNNLFLNFFYRYEDGTLVCPKIVLASPIAAYENTVEVSNLNQLEEIISDPDGMRMQALLVRERILGPAHPDTSYYIRYRGAVYADMGHFERCITLWMYALDMQQKMLEPLSPMTQSSLLSFAELFSYMMSEGRNRNNNSNQRRYVYIRCCYTHVTYTVK